MIEQTIFPNAKLYNKVIFSYYFTRSMLFSIFPHSLVFFITARILILTLAMEQVIFEISLIPTMLGFTPNFFSIAFSFAIDPRSVIPMEVFKVLILTFTVEHTIFELAFVMFNLRHLQFSFSTLFSFYKWACIFLSFSLESALPVHLAIFPFTVVKDFFFESHFAFAVGFVILNFSRVGRSICPFASDINNLFVFLIRDWIFARRSWIN